MGPNTIGDLASSLLLRTRSAELKTEMTRLVEGITSGKVDAAETAVGGSFRAVSGIQQSLSRLDAYDIAATEAAGYATAQQAALEGVQTRTTDLSAALLSAGQYGQVQQLTLYSSDAKSAFDAAVAQLNTEYAGRYVFAGVQSDSRPLIDAATILDELKLAVSGETTATGVTAAVEAWFGSGGGYETLAYRGGEGLATLTIGQGSAVTLDITAEDAAIRETLAGLGLAALIADGPLAGDSDAQAELATAAGTRLQSAGDNLVTLQARLGLSEERIEDTRTEIAAETTAMNTALSEIVTADPFEWSAELEQVETQLELLYALTARAASLKLTDFL